MFGYGIGRVWLSDVNCHGNESDITDCNRDTQGGINCDHSNDAGVICNSKMDWTFLLSPENVSYLLNNKETYLPNHSQEHSLSLSPRFAKWNVTQLLIG